MSPALAPRIRALVVDDSPVARRLVSQALSGDPDMEVMGFAESGEQALEWLSSSVPDVVVLDLAMPGMDGVETLRELKRRSPHLPVLVYSAHTERGSETTLNALLAGADDYALKPSGTAATTVAWEASRAELRQKVKALTQGKRSLPVEAPSSARHLVAGAKVAIQAVAIGTSLGGPDALDAVLSKLPAGLGVPLFVVQHMPVGFTSALAKRLNDKSRLQVVEARHGQPVAPNVVYLAPGDYHMRLSRRHQSVSMLLDQGPRENGCRPAVDPMFASAAAIYGAHLLACVLTGMGSDGAIGAKAVDQAGGHVWIQDEESATSWGMAGAVARAGLASRTLSLATLPVALEKAITQGLPERHREEVVPSAR
jgi:two-component system, chemotaxis family, protein-glutamate methylesterase/glutaminase